MAAPQPQRRFETDWAPPPGGPPWWRMRFWSITTWLLVLNVAVFLLQAASHEIEPWGHFSVTTGLYHLQLWRFITFQFLHAGPGHLIFNMLALYFFGPLVESYSGRRRYLAFYLLCGVAGA